MTLQSTERHRRIAQLQGKIFGGIAAVVAVLTLAFGGVQSVQNSEVHDKAVAAQTRADFWQVVDGTKATTGSFAADKLAFDLGDALAADRSPATELPKSITDFVAGPSGYPGVVDALGFTPFNDTNQPCSACGPLNGHMLTGLTEVQHGNGGIMVQAELDAAPHVAGLTLTPLGMSGVLWVGFLYAAGSIGALVIAVRRDTKTNDYDQRLLNWKSDGGSSADPYKRISHIISPLYFITVIPIRRKLGKDYQGALHEIGFDEEYMIIRRELKKLDALPDAKRFSSDTVQMRQQLEEVLAKLNEKVKLSGNGNTVEIREQSLEEVKAEVKASIDSVLNSMRIRDESMAALEPQNALDEIERATQTGRENRSVARRQPPEGETSPRSSSR